MLVNADLIVWLTEIFVKKDVVLLECMPKIVIMIKIRLCSTRDKPIGVPRALYGVERC